MISFALETTTGVAPCKILMIISADGTILARFLRYYSIEIDLISIVINIFWGCDRS